MLKFCDKILFCKYYNEKREGSGPGSKPLTNGSGSQGCPKTCGSELSIIMDPENFFLAVSKIPVANILTSFQENVLFTNQPKHEMK